MFKEHEENVVKLRYGDDASSKKECQQRSLLEEIKWTHESGSTIMKSTIPKRIPITYLTKQKTELANLKINGNHTINISEKE